MEILGTWRVKEMFSVSTTGFGMMSAEEIADMEETPKNVEHKRMIAAEFIIGETSLDVYYRPREGEEDLAEKKGWTVTDRGLLIESFPAVIEDGVLSLDYSKTGAGYTPVYIDPEGTLSLSFGIIKLKRA